jgi:hypothetical protein
MKTLEVRTFFDANNGVQRNARWHSSASTFSG